MRRSKSDYVIQTVTNALRLLEEFRYAEELGVTELARRLGLHKNNVFRLLATLEEMRYVEQCAETERYRLGTACLALGQAFSRTRSLTRLGALGAREARARDARDPPISACSTTSRSCTSTARRPTSWWARAPHRRAPARALQRARQGDARLRGPGGVGAFDREWIRGGELPASTDATITDRDKFFEHLRGAAGMGFAIDLEECAPGLCCVAAPVRDASSRVVAALSVSAPVFRVGETRMHERIVPRGDERRAGALAPPRSAPPRRPLARTVADAPVPNPPELLGTVTRSQRWTSF